MNPPLSFHDVNKEGPPQTAGPVAFVGGFPVRRIKFSFLLNGQFGNL